MRFIKISNSELVRIRKMYEGLMAKACNGLFFREGLAIGEEFAEVAMKSDEDFFSTIKEMLKYRGWISEINFEDGKITVKGSAEVQSGTESETCHRLRGILQKIIEEHNGLRARFTEEKCESLGSPNCVFTYIFLSKEVDKS